MSGFLKFRRNDASTSTSTGKAKAIRELKDGDTGLPFNMEYSGIAAGIDFLKDPNAIDDRKMLLEVILTKLSEFPKGSLEKRLEQITVEMLYNDLPHPPLTSVGNEYAWRSADGSGNNVVSPELGKAGNPYARSVSQTNPLPRHQLPDPGLVFDTLLRREKFTPHPAGLSSLMFSFAALVIHSVFRTNHDNVNINETSSYVDLAPLYGVNQQKQNEVRVRDGRGLLHPDVFSEDRLLLLPPAVCVLLVLFNRNHNHIAQKLLEINERGTWKDPDHIPADTPNRAEVIIQQEEEIFQIARLINCGWFGFVVFSDYFSAILGLVRQGNSWSLDPFSEFRKEDHALFERGRGNVCSVEFNCLYRWHATTSQADEEWVERLMTHTFPGKESDEISVQEFKSKLKEIQQGETDCTTWTFGGLKRGSDGKFRNEDLAAILKTQTEHPAASFGARGTPSNMRWMEVMGMEAARRWGCCSLNDFRQYLGLRRYKSFLEWNPDKEIAAAAEKLYGEIDNLELYAGLQAEATKPVVKGAGLCPGFTISRAILADAVALIRGDRFFTADFTPHNLTSWGIADCARSPDNPGFGSMLGRLFLRTLPDEFTDNSTYAWFPLMTPQAMDEILTKVGGKDKYDFVRPKTSDAVVEFKEYGEVAGILANKDKFRYPFLHRISSVIHGAGFFLASDSPERGEREQRQMFKALAETAEQVEAITKFFHENTEALIKKNSFKLVGGERSGLDIVRDVFRVVPIQWVATQVAGITLKKPENDTEKTFTETELFDVLADIYAYCFLDIEGGQILKTGNRVETEIKLLMDHIEANVGGGGIVKRLSVNGFVGTLSRMFSNRQDLADRLQNTGTPTSQNANSVLAVMVGASVELAQALTLMLNILLDQPEVVKGLLSADKDEVLEGYVTEMLRIDPPLQGIYREAKANEAVGTTSVKAGDLIYLDITTANKNERAFADPSKIDCSRPKEHYLRGDVLTRTLGTSLVSKIVINTLRAVFELKNVTRGPGQSGELKRFSAEIDGIKLSRYIDKTQQLSPWTTSLVVTYDN